MATQPNALATAQQITTQVGAMIPLAQISSVVQTLSNIQGFNPGAFSQLSGTIQSALTGFTQASSIIQGFAAGSPIQAITNTLSATGLAGSSISGIAGAAASAYQQADSFLSASSATASWQRLNSRRPSVEEARATNIVGNGLQFPKDMGKYWIYLGFEKANIGSITGANAPVRSRRGTGNVILPLPINLTDANHLEYQALSLTGAVAGMGANIFDAVGGIGRIGNFFGVKADNMGAFGNFLTSGASALGNAAETAGALIGEAVNTHQTLKFVQPTLKNHSFTWKLVPSSKEESEMLHTIIKYIKSRIYPTSTGLTFSYPDLVNVYMYNADKMFYFKPAYVSGFAVNYTTEGGPAFHKDSYPVSVQIDMNITETSVWLSTDQF
jgi:hypothetical protein